MGHWAISSALEPIYIDDKWDNPSYDSRLDPENIGCMMCPCSLEECDKRGTCYWDDYWHDSMEQAGWFDRSGDWHSFDEESEE